MRILWIVNTIFPEPAKSLNLKTGVSGGWMFDFADKAAGSGIKLAIASFYEGKHIMELEIKNITYYLLPGGSRRMMFYCRDNERLWNDINNRFSPDIVHLHGTEYSHGLAFLRAKPNIPAVVSIQGILRRIAQEYFGGISVPQLLRYRTLSENLHLNGMIEQKLLLSRNAQYEKEILNRVKYVHVINMWDYSVTKLINEKLKIYKYDFNLRPQFYEAKKWDINNFKRHSIITGQCSTPLKGLHILIKALEIVKKSYPDVMLTVSGVMPNSGYYKYIKQLIKSTNLSGNIIFAGPLDVCSIIKQMQNAHIAIIPSAIEGTSMFLREAMFLGLPSIAAFRGGMADYIKDGQSGFLYDYCEYSYLAQRITQLFGSDRLLQDFSQGGIILSEEHHNREKNCQAMLNMYNEIILENQA